MIGELGLLHTLRHLFLLLRFLRMRWMGISVVGMHFVDGCKILVVISFPAVLHVVLTFTSRTLIGNVT